MRIGVRAGLVLALVLIAVWPTVEARAEASAQRGRELFERGLVDGQPVGAVRPGAGPLPPQAAACASCHRRSGMGGAEGNLAVPPIRGVDLWAAGAPGSPNPRLKLQWLRHQSRSAYTPESLAVLLARGVDPDGQAVGAAMPRYDLSPQALADLVAYLDALGSAPVAGLEAGSVHVATVVTPQAPAPRRRAVETAMAAWSAQMTLGARKVRWHLWTLDGEPATYGAQLAAYWRAQPVFTVLSGAGGGADDWAPVSAFCEAQRVPCLFPSIDQMPEIEPVPYWSVYLNSGLRAEARMLVHWLRTRRSPGGAGQPPSGAPSPQLWQVAVVGSAGHDAAMTLARLLADEFPTDGPAPSSIQAPGDALPAGFEGVVMLWLTSDDAAAWLQRQGSRARPQQSGLRVVLSGSLAPVAQTPVPEVWRPATLWVSQQAEPIRAAAGGALSLAPWSSRLMLPADLHPPTLMDVHAATFFFADAVALSRGRLQPDYLLERLEVSVDQRPAGAGYARLSLGPGQRVAAQGGYMLGFMPPAHREVGRRSGYLRSGN